MRRVLVAGGAGFLGSHLCEALLARGDEVLCLDNLVTGRLANLAALMPEPSFRFVRADVTDPVAVDGPLDAVLHLASPASPKDYLRWPIETLASGSVGTSNLLELACRKSARFFLASTSEVYGDPAVNPQPEEYWGHVNPVGPRSVYDESKRFAEALTVAFARTRGVDVRIGRLFNTYGPRLSPADGRVVSNFLVQALEERPITVYGDGTQTRSFCYVSDEVEGILRLLESDFSSPVNLGNSAEITIRELVEVVREVTGCSSPVHHRPLPEDDPAQRRPDLTLARKILDWSPETDLVTGLARTADWLRTVL